MHWVLSELIIFRISPFLSVPRQWAYNQIKWVNMVTEESWHFLQLVKTKRDKMEVYIQVTLNIYGSRVLCYTSSIARFQLQKEWMLLNNTVLLMKQRIDLSCAYFQKLLPCSTVGITGLKDSFRRSLSISVLLKNWRGQDSISSVQLPVQHTHLPSGTQTWWLRTCPLPLGWRDLQWQVRAVFVFMHRGFA